MNRLAVLAILCLALAGCSTPPEAEPVTETDDVPEEPTALGFVLDEPPKTVNGNIWTATGSIARPAFVTVGVSDYSAQSFQLDEAGPWSFDIELDGWGITQGELIAKADGVTEWATFEVNGLAPATITLDFGPGNPTPSTRDDVWVNLVEYDAQAMYDERDAQHPGYANVHDAMVAWERQTEHVVSYSHNDGFGSFGVERIDGAGNSLSAGEPPWWCYRMNNDASRSDFGISLQRFTPGDTIRWDLGACA